MFNARLRPLGLTVAQFGLLAAIARMPDQPLSAISGMMLLDESTLARNLAVLERRGLVESDGGRGRVGKRMLLTQEGVELHASGVKLWRKANADLAGELKPSVVAAGRAFLKALSEASERLKAAENAGSERERG